MPTYDFLCPNGHTTEHITSWVTPELPCSVCGLPAKRVTNYGKNSRVVMAPPPIKLTGWRKSIFSPAKIHKKGG